MTTDAQVLDPRTVAEIARRFTGTQIAALAWSHERLREMLVESAERIGKQSELLSAKGERSESSP